MPAVPWLTTMSPRTLGAAAAPGAARTPKGPIGMLRTGAPASAGYHRATGIGAAPAAAGTVIARQPTSAATAGQAANPNAATATATMKLRTIMAGSPGM